jgi:NAD(P)-dependent dehydrogenase (short-subunit alcohol dehydrogenase family)
MGAHVAVVDVNEAGAVEVASTINSRGGPKAVGIACDVGDPASVDAMVARVVAEFGAIDVLLNNAATKGTDVRAFFAAVEDYSPQVWREVMGINLDGMFFVAQRVGKQMITQGRGGSIVQTSSVYGMVGPDQRIYEGSNYLGGPINTPAPYAASKAAVIGLTRYLATSWAAHGIRVNCLVPGGVESGQNDDFVRRYSARVPMGRMARADEIVGTVQFLACGASSYITGQAIAVDGGLTAW